MNSTNSTSMLYRLSMFASVNCLVCILLLSVKLNAEYCDSDVIFHSCCFEELVTIIITSIFYIIIIILN